MTTHERLPDVLLFEQEGANEGHLTDIAMTAIADGQHEILSSLALAHFETCEACAHAVGGAALLSAETDLLLAEATLASSLQKELVHAKSPVGAVALAVMVALCAAGPVAFGVSTHAATFLRVSVQLLATLGHLAVVISRGSPEISQVRAISSYASALMLLMMGFAVAKKQTHAAWK